MVPILECALILCAVWRPLRAALDRRFAVAYPAIALKLRRLFAVMAFALAAVLLWVPGLLHLTAFGSVAFVALERWRARPSWGRGRRLAPGSLSIFPETWTNDRFYLQQLARYGPIFKTSNFLRPVVCVVGLEAGIQLLRDHEDRLETPALPFSRFVPGGMLRYMRDPDHQHYRSIFQRALGSDVVRQLLPGFVLTIKQALDEMRAASAAAESGLAPLPYLDRLMFDLWMRLFFAIEPGSAESKLLQSLYPIIQIENPARARADEIRQAVQAISKVVEGKRDSWQGSPAPCLLGAIMADREADAWDRVVIGNLLYLLSTTQADMSALFCWLLKMLSDNPGWNDKLAQDSSASNPWEPLALPARIVAETLRLRQSEFIYRFVRSDIEFFGFLIPRGWLLRICVWESHRDAAVFPQPDRFNPDRFLERSYSRTEYSPFGASSHACIAQKLVIQVASLFVGELGKAYCLSCHSAGLLELGSKRHWRPDAGFRIRLLERA